MSSSVNLKAASRDLVAGLMLVWAAGSSNFALADGPTKPQSGSQKPESTSSDRPSPPADFKTVYNELLHVTCHIEAFDKKNVNWCGTGWIVDAPRRLIVTNHHVACPKERAEVREVFAWFPVIRKGEAIHDIDYYVKSVKKCGAKLIYADATRDLALMQLDHLPDAVRPVTLSEDSPPTGARLHSLGGFPRGSKGLFIYTQGTTRAVYKRNIATGGQIQVIETQMPLNQGNSGGPIVDDQGHLVGVFEGLNIEPGVQLVNMCIDLSEVQAFLKEGLPLAEPKSAAEFNKRGDLHFESERYDLAMADYNQALKLDPKDVAGTSNRGWVHHQRGDLETALAEFHAALKLDENFANALWGRGMVYRDQEKYEPSIADFTAAIRHATEAKDLAGLYNERGNTYAAENKYELALADFDRAIEKDPTLAWPHANRGEALGNLKRYDEAFASIDKAIALDNKNAQFWNIAGNIWFDRERWDFAINMYTNAIQRDPKTAMYFRNRAESQRRQQRYQDAIGDMIKSLELDPQQHEHWNELGLSWFDAGRYDQAVIAFSKSVELSPAVATYFRNRGDAQQRLAQHQAAIDDLTKAITIEDTAELRKMRGNSYQALGKASLAKADFEKATAADPSNKLYDRKYIRVVNETSEKLKVYMKYYTYTTDKEWKWFPTSPDKAGAASYTFEPGESAILYHQEWKVNGNRFRIWAEAGGRTWPEFRDKDFAPVPEGGYLTSDEDYDTATFRFMTGG